MRVMGLDIGYGATKVVTSSKLTSFPTLVAPASRNKFSITDREQFIIEVDGKEFYVGEDAETSSHTLELRYDTWFKEIEYLAIFKRALIEVEPGKIFLIVGLPVSEYEKWKEFLKERLLGQFQVNGHDYLITDVKVLPQPFGSFFHHCLDNFGNFLPDKEQGLKGTIGVIDIGFRTTDLILVDRGNYNDVASGTIDIGVSNLVTYVQDGVYNKFGLKLNIPKTKEALKNGHIVLYDKAEDISGLLEKGTAHFARFISDKAKVLWGTVGFADEVLLCGGGAHYYQSELKKIIPHIKCPLNPELSNAYGYFKYGVKRLLE